MNDEEKDALIYEALGETFPKQRAKVRPLENWEGFGWWWERSQKMEWWEEFLAYHWLLASTPRSVYKIVNPIRGRDALAEFLSEVKD